MTKRAHYMTFRDRRPDDRDALGGRPWAYPDAYPWPQKYDDVIGFVMQLWVDGNRLDIPGIEWIHLYQGFEDGDDPTPIVVLIRKDCGLEKPPRELPVHPGIREQGVDFECCPEPDALPSPLDPSVPGKYFSSKLGGLDPWGGFHEGVFLGQLNEFDPGLNFGGSSCGLYLMSDGSVAASLR